MAVNLAFIGGAGWQFFDDNGNPLSGGKIYTYAAGTTTPLATYTSRSGLIPNTNPIILDAAGRTPEEIWSTEGLLYKYVVKTANDVLIRSWDNIGGSVVASDLAADLANTTNNAKGDALIGFRQSNSAGFLTGATARTVNAKLQEFVSVKDFGAVGDGVTDDTAAFAAAFAASKRVYVPEGTYVASVDLPNGGKLYGAGNHVRAANSNTVICPPASAAYAIQIKAAGGVGQSAWHFNCEVKNLTVANLNYNLTAPGIYVNSVFVTDVNDLHVFEDVSVIGFETNIKVRGRLIGSTWTRVHCTGYVVFGSVITNIHLDVNTDPTDVSFNENVFQSCFFSTSLTSAIKIVGQNVANRFASCAIEGCNQNNTAGVASVYVEESRNMVFEQCYFESNGTGVPIDNTTISNNAVDIKFSNSNSTSSTHYNAAVKDCWFLNSGICVWIGKADNTGATPNTFMRGGELSNNLMIPRTNGYAFYSSISQLNVNDAPFIIDASNQIAGKVVVLRDGNRAYACAARQADAVQTFNLTATINTIVPLSRNIAVNPDGSGTNLAFSFLFGGLSFTIHNTSTQYALVMDPNIFYSDTGIVSNWTIPPLTSRQYVVEGSSSSPTYKLFETTTQIRSPYAPPIRGYYNQGDIVLASSPVPGGFIGRVITTSGGGAEAARNNSTAYLRGQWISIGATVNECITPGITDVAPPATPTAIDQLTTDGTVVWKCRALTTAVAKTYGAISL